MGEGHDTIEDALAGVEGAVSELTDAIRYLADRLDDEPRAQAS